MSSPIYRHTGTVRPAVFTAFPSPGVKAPSEPTPDDLVPDPTALLAEAQARAEAAGYADGFTQGRAAGEAIFNEQVGRLRKLVDGAVHDLQAALRQLEPQLVELTLAIAERVIERELTTQRDLVVDVVRASLSAAGSLPIVRVRVHPDDHAFVSVAWPSLSSFTAESQIELVPDPQIQPGGCIVDTTSGLIDAQPTTRLAEIREQLLAIIGGSS